jgi:hypothetical protein
MLRVVVVHEEVDDYYSHDCKRIVEAFKGRDLYCTAEEAKMMWERFSSSMCAGWMHVPEDNNEILGTLSPYYEVGHAIEVVTEEIDHG